jgi:hypothetical protein
MATILRARQVAERALRLIGAYSINETAARAEYVDEALYWLDMIQAELAGTVQCFWLLTETLSFDLTAATVDYDLETLLSGDWPAEGIEYVVNAWLENEVGSRFPLEIKRRRDFENVSTPDLTGTPEWLYIDRTATPTVRTYPTLSDTSQTWSVKLVIQKQAPIIAGVGPVPKTDAGESIETGLPAAWNRYAVYALGADIGNGPVRKLPLQSIEDYRQQAAIAMTRMQEFQNREQETTDPITQGMDFD